MSAPNSPAALQQSLELVRRALALQQANAMQDAVATFQKALQLAPLNGTAWHGLLVLLLQLRSLDNALQVVQAIPPALYAQSATLRQLHGKLLVLLDRAEEALAVLQPLQGEATLEAGDLANDLGSTCNRLDRLEDALGYYRQAHAAGLRGKTLFWNMATVLHKLGRFDEADAVFREGLALYPGDAGMEYEQAFSLLAREHYARGFALLRQRWQAPQFGHRPWALPLPQWDGTTPVRSLLVLQEQGIGDQIIYSTFLPAVAQRVGQVTVAFDPRLSPLLLRSYPDIRVASSAELADEATLQQRFDAWMPAGDLGSVAPEAIGWRDGHLQADHARAAALRAGYQARYPGKRLVGICWRSTRQLHGARKTVDILEWQALLQQPDCQFISLQYGDTTADIARARAAFGVEILQDPAVDAFDDIDGLAAQAHACDLVISTSNSGAHVAAATGAPTWVILPHGGSLFWYWGLRERDCAWYPRARLFRAPAGRTWQPVMAQVAAALRDEAPWATAVPAGAPSPHQR